MSKKAANGKPGLNEDPNGKDGIDSIKGNSAGNFVLKA